MSSHQANITLGTAGHIDHGKTLLVKCLTGCETDCLREEKQRGMSIDLGFAPCHCADLEVGIVDVPGHENFIKTMVAGASGMDGVILVVAADDGVMPQTREHLDILTLLGIQHGVVALTKIDRVDPVQREVVTEQIREYLQGTFLGEAPILPISNVTGEGFGPFHKALSELVRTIEPKRVDGVFRLPVDRSFSVMGYGPVVSGIPLSGSAAVGDEIVLLPQQLKGRIKAIQVYKQMSERVLAGQCAALNVRDWDPKGIRRGDTVAVPGYFEPAEWCICALRLLPHEKSVLKNGSQARFHTGTADVTATVYLTQGQQIERGAETIVQLRCRDPIVAGPGDHFIVRSLTPVQTIGGGTVIETATRRLKRNRPEILDDLRDRRDAVGVDSRFVEYCIRSAEEFVATRQELSTRAKIQPDRLQTILETMVTEGKIIQLAPDRYIHADTADRLADRIMTAVGEFHDRSPESPGSSLEDLEVSSGITKDLLRSILRRLRQDGRLVERHGRYALPEHRDALPDDQRDLLERIEALFRDAEFQPPGVDEIAERCGLAKDKTDKCLSVLVEHERLVKVERDLFFHHDAVDRARRALTDFIQKEGKLESVKFKYLLDTTRKYAIPLLDYFDRIGLTRRVNNTRYLRSS
jgi:selenocysteine-specific elongation factor